MAGDDWKPTVPERPSSRDSAPTHDESVSAFAPERERPPPASQRYVGGEEIARGGMGRVIEATDTLLARTVAVKEALTSDPETLRRFARETRITARLEHPSIVPVYDAGTDPNAPFYVMRRVTGRPLSGLISAAKSLDERLALIPHVLACAQAIAHAHRRGVIHRDIKPSNILVGELGETVVIDWGIAKVIGENDPSDELPPMAGDSLRTRIGTVSGTPGFMSPEQARGDELGPSADVWALGATLYYVLSRQMPHELHAKSPDDLMSLAAHRHVPPIASVVSGVPPELAAITERALAFEVAERFPDAASFAEELSRFLTGQIVASHDYSVRERLFRWIKRHRAIVAIALLALTVVGIVSAIAIGRVLDARERADASARLAEAARAKEQLQAQAELLARGRALATTHPTSAIAAIDQLPAGSPLASEADAIFATAISHGGAAWALARNSGIVLAVEIDPSGSKVAQLDRSWLLRVWDLDRRELVVEKQLPTSHYVEWTSRGLLIFGGPTVQLLDVTTKQMSGFGSLALRDVAASEDGTQAAGLTANGVAGWIDVATGTLTPVVSDQAIDAIAIPEDGSWLATSGKGEVVVHDRTGAVVLRRRVDQATMITSRSKRLAILHRDVLSEAVVEPNATWIDRSGNGVVWGQYYDEVLTGRSPSTIFAFHRPRTPPSVIARIDGLSSSMSHAGEGMVAFTTGATATKLLYFDLVRQLSIPLPDAFRGPRVTSRRGSTRIVVAGNAITLVIDLRYLLPRKRTSIRGSKVQFVTDTQIVAHDPGGSWVLHDGDERRATLDGVPPHASLDDISQGRVLWTDRPMSTNHLYMLDVARMEVFHAEGQIGRLLEGGLLYVRKGKLWLRRDGHPEGRELGDLRDGEVFMAGDGPRFFVFAGGEVVRGDITSGILEKRPFVLPERGAILAVDGRLLVANDKHLHWDTIDGPLVGTVEDTVTGMYLVPGGAVANLASGVTMFINLAANGTASIVHLSASTVTATGDTGRVIATSPRGTEVIELPSRRRWIHPISTPMSHRVAIPPKGASLLELGTDFSWWEWTLPPPGLAIDAIRHTATNAREQDDRVLLWPWQVTDEP